MTISQFKSLPEEEKANATWQGEYLIGRKTSQYNILLYDVDGFYVEVLVNNQSHSIEKFRAFQSTTFLEPYLSKIDISGAIPFFT